MRFWIAALALCSLGSGVLAQALPSIQRDPAVAGLRALGTPEEAARWNAVGRLDTGASFCSATLIAPDLVLTAAHCLFHPRTDAAFAPEDLVFSAGLHNGRAAAVRVVRRAIVLPGYSPETGAEIGMIGLDLALLELREPIPQGAIRPLATGRPGGDAELVTVVSYGADRAAYASIEENCRVLAVRGTVRSLSCAVDSGASGSPVLRVSGGQVEVVGVMSAMAMQDGADFSLAVALDAQFAQLLGQRALRHPIGPSAPAATFLGAGNDGRDSIGARFVRP